MDPSSNNKMLKKVHQACKEDQMKTFLKKLTYIIAAAAMFTVGAANLYAADNYPMNDLTDEWYSDGPMLQDNEVQRFDDIHTGGSDF
jgi:hypothetical protein